jgi:hypothetical protein
VIRKGSAKEVLKSRRRSRPAVMLVFVQGGSRLEEREGEKLMGVGGVQRREGRVEECKQTKRGRKAGFSRPKRSGGRFITTLRATHGGEG